MLGYGYGRKTQSFMKNGGQQKLLNKALDGYLTRLIDAKLLVKHAPKKKKIGANQAAFLNEKINKEIVIRIILLDIFGDTFKLLELLEKEKIIP